MTRTNDAGRHLAATHGERLAPGTAPGESRAEGRFDHLESIRDHYAEQELRKRREATALLRPGRKARRGPAPATVSGGKTLQQLRRTFQWVWSGFPEDGGLARR